MALLTLLHIREGCVDATSCNRAQRVDQMKSPAQLEWRQCSRRAHIGNYRPVSLTRVMCKLMELIICTHICSHLDRHDILSDLNHKFQSRHSCESQLMITTHDFLSRMDRKEVVDLLVLDFGKAFDTVPHKRCLQKSKLYYIHGELLSGIRSFLYARTQSVVVDGCHSPEDKVLSEVPQGTGLGPLSFLCHINDLPSVVEKRLSDYSRIIACYIGPLPQAQTTDSFNLISSDMSWSSHSSSIVHKAHQRLGFIRRNLRGSPFTNRDIAY